MANKYFNKKVKVKSTKSNLINSLIIALCVVGIAVCFFVTKGFNSTSSSDTNVNIREGISVDINSTTPSTSLFFNSLEGVNEEDIKVDYSEVKFSKLGDYKVTITINDVKYYSKISVVDVTAPVLELKNLIISEGENYTYTDFVDECYDNSRESCIISFFVENVNGTDGVIDYTSFKNAGYYQVKIVAADSSGNEIIKSATLQIGETEKSDQVSCTYGDLQYDDAYILTYNAGINGCALDLNLHSSESVRSVFESIVDTEINKIKVDIDGIQGLGNKLTINKNIISIFNETFYGFVGYSLYVEIIDGDENLLVSYYLNSDLTRTYIENPLNLK